LATASEVAGGRTLILQHNNYATLQRNNNAILKHNNHATLQRNNNATLQRNNHATLQRNLAAKLLKDFSVLFIISPLGPGRGTIQDGQPRFLSLYHWDLHRLPCISV
jgi:hypothetical protein